MKYYLNKWNNKAKKLKNRDNKLKKGIDEIEKKNENHPTEEKVLNLKVKIIKIDKL